MRTALSKGTLCVLALLSIAWNPLPLLAEEAGDSFIMQSLEETNRLSEKEPLPKLTTVPAERPASRLLLGINYTGGQARWNLSSRWAAEARYQQGSASSHYGDVTAHVFGARLYRFFKTTYWLPLYVSSEFAITNATPESSHFKTDGFAAGVVGGLEYHLGGRFYVDADLGPYVISLKESYTQMSSTNLDFVVNSALLMRIF